MLIQEESLGVNAPRELGTVYVGSGGAQGSGCTLRTA